MKRSQDKPVVAGNWKMNKNARESIEFFHGFLREITDEAEQAQFILFPQNINLLAAKQILGPTKVGWGAQNCYPKESGAFTGETSPQALSEVGAQYCLIGHSERRTIFKESDEFIADKLVTLQSWGVTPVLCIGETKEQRDQGKTEEVLKNQLEIGLSKNRIECPLIIAYEPVWAIGTGDVATPEQAGLAHKFIRSELASKYTEDYANQTVIMYGGSVKPDSSKSLFAQEHVDGFLVGGASLEVSSFISIYKNV